MSIKEHRLHEILTHVASKFCMQDWSFKVEENRETYENYIGVLIPLTVIGVFKAKKITQSVYVKLPSLDESVRALSGYLWDAEVYVYRELVPLWKSVINVEVDEIIPKCYFADATPGNQALVLQDLRYLGYQKYNETFLDVEHVIVSLKTLAQFHALSLILKKDHRDLDVSVLRPYTEIYPHEFNKALRNSFQKHSQLFRNSKYEHYWEEILANYKTIVTEATLKAKCLVYGHGDYWKENIMYKYENNCPVKACTFDFQSCQVMTPAQDFLYFILNSTRGTLRRLQYHKFLHEYYATLQSTLFENGIQLDLLYSKADFISDLKMVASHCFIRICLAFSLWLGFESDTTIKSKNTWESDQRRDEQLSFFKDLLVDAMEDLCDYGYISL